jgi:pyruvate/2-oxoacid:ferredoxin oxidoreductase alpha subunit
MLLNSQEKREFENDYFVNKMSAVKLAEKYRTSRSNIARYLKSNYGLGGVRFTVEQIVFILKSNMNEVELAQLIKKPESVIKRILDCKNI